jgi:hypothetical protein
MKEVLFVNGLNGSYQGQFAKFVGMNELGMSEKSESRVEYGISEISKRKMMEEYLAEIGITS